jgi:hypothetical protein
MSQDEMPIDLSTIISFAGFWNNHAAYRRGELDILQPRMEALGYMDIEWYPGETDSFGPLTRMCKALNTEGETVIFFYG